jgi:hypothetical protein
VLDDPHLSSATLTDILVLARSEPSYDELIDYVVSCAPALVGCDDVEVRPAHHVLPPDGDTGGPLGGHVLSHPVVCGDVPWGELRLTYLEGPAGLGEIRRGRLLAEVLGAALLSARVEGGPSARAGRTPAGSGAVPERPHPDDLVDLVLDCAEALDLMADASTRARLALVATRVAGAVGATSWCVAVAHHGRLYDVACAGRAGGSDDGLGAGGSVVLTDVPARMRASEGGAFYADRDTGDDAERRALVEDDHEAVVGAGGYDLDGRSWVVEVFADSGSRLEQLPPVLFSLVLAALSFPREAVVPRPVEPAVRAVLDGSGAGYQGAPVRGIGEAG